MASVTVRVMASAPEGGSVVGVLETRVAVVVERADSLDPVRAHGGAPGSLHHDRDGLLDGLPGAHLDRAFDRLHGRRRIAGDLRGDLVCRRHQLGRRMYLV